MDDVPTTKHTLFGGEFQSSLTSRVEMNTALSKAVLIMSKSKREEAASSVIRRERPTSSQFFKGQVRKQAGQELLSVYSTSPTSQGWRPHSREVSPYPPKTRAETSDPLTPYTVRPDIEGPTQEVLRCLKSVPQNDLDKFGMRMNLTLVKQTSHLPMGGRTAHFVLNWRKLGFKRPVDPGNHRGIQTRVSRSPSGRPLPMAMVANKETHTGARGDRTCKQRSHCPHP